MTTETTILSAKDPSPGHAACRDLIERIISGRLEYDVLREKRSDVFTARVSDDDGGTVIVKIWQKRGMRSTVRRLAGMSAARHEWRALQRMNEVGIPAAHSLGFATGGGPAPWQGIVMSDLGVWPRGSECLGELLAQDRLEDANQFEDRVIEVTHRMITAEVVDVDHTLMNFLAVDRSNPVRVDLELARIGGRAIRSTKRHGEMLGRLIGSHYYVSHGRGERVTAFAERLADAVGPSKNTLGRARARIEAMADRQYSEHGIKPDLRLPF